MNLTIHFTDGTSKEIPILKAYEIQLGPEYKQSIEFRQTGKGWVMSYTKSVLDGKNPTSIEIRLTP